MNPRRHMVEHLRAVLAHELAHVRRYDHLVNLCQMLVEALLFFNPAVWWLSRQIRIEREACCDAAAIAASGGPHDYARGAAGRHCRTGERHVVPVADDARRLYGVARLALGHGFPGQHGLVHVALPLDDRAIHGDLLAGAHTYSIADRDIGDRHFNISAVAGDLVYHLLAALSHFVGRPVGDQLFEVSVGRGDHPHIHGNGLMVAYLLDNLFLQDTQQFGLGGQM